MGVAPFLSTVFAFASVEATRILSEEMSGESGSGENGSGETGGDKLSMGVIAAIVIATLVGAGAIVACVLAWFFCRAPPAPNTAALAGTGATFGKRIPSLVISAEALAGKV